MGKNAKENVKALQSYSKLKLANFNGLSNQDLKNKYGSPLYILDKTTLAYSFNEYIDTYK